MTSIGTGYDLQNSVFSPDGRNFPGIRPRVEPYESYLNVTQVEYAVKAVENGGTCVGIRCADGIVLATEKLISTSLVKPSANRRIATVDTNIGVVSAGLVPDGQHFVTRARDEASSWRSTYKSSIPVKTLAARLSSYVQAYTLYSSVRPFGIAAIIGGWDSEDDANVDGQVGEGPKSGPGGRNPETRRGGPGLYMVEPSGLSWGYYGAATGKGRQSAKAELEKLDLSPAKLPLLQGVKEAARIIYAAHEDSKDKDFEIEMSWISSQNGPSHGRHEQVPRDLVEEATRLAIQAIEGEGEETTDADAEKMEE